MLAKILRKYKPDSVLLKILENKKLSALIKLAFWMIFLALIYFLLLMPAKDNLNLPVESSNKNEESKITDIKDMEDNLLKYNFSYIYNVSNDYEKIVYTGSYQMGKNNGFKEVNGNIIKYYTDETGNYYIINDEKELTDYLYENINPDYLNIAYIFDIINKSEYEIDEENSELIINNEEALITVTINEDNIQKIEINDNTFNYLLEFSNIK